MRSRGFAGRRLRSTALLALGALGLHQLRYFIAYGHDAPSALEGAGHGYLMQVAPLLVAIAAAAVLASLALPALLRVTGIPARLGGVVPTASAYAAALLAVFSLQELAEGALFAGHEPGLAGVLAHGGWVALPLAAVLGLATALIARLLDSAEHKLVRALARPQLARAPRRLESTAPHGARRPLASFPLSFGLARRPPPPFRVG